MAKEIRVTFTDKEKDIYDFIKSKSSASNFIKDLVKLEKERQENYTNAVLDNNIEKVVEVLASKIGSVEFKKEDDSFKKDEQKSEFDFDLNDLDLD